MTTPHKVHGRSWLHRRHAIAIAFASAAARGFANPALAQARSKVIAFAPGTTDGLPNGFSTARTGHGAPSAWSLVADTTVSSGYVLAQTSADGTDYRFPLAIYDPVSAAGVEVTVRFKAVAGRVDRAGGIAIRLADPDNYYVVRANALEDNVNFYRVVGGSRREIKGASAKVASDTWHTLGLQADGDQFAISFNGKTLFAATDRTFTAPGRIALWTKADSVTYFDSLMLKVIG